MYPNPANDQLTLQFSANHQGTSFIIGLARKTVCQQLVMSDEANDVSTLSQGGHLLHSQDGQ